MQRRVAAAQSVQECFELSGRCHYDCETLMRTQQHHTAYHGCINSNSNEPSHLDPRQNHFIAIDKDFITATYVGKGMHTDVGAVQSNVPAPRDRHLYYFEVRVLAVPNSSTAKITVGITTRNFLLNRQPGAEASSVGYRGEDGRKLQGSLRTEAYGPGFTVGDVVGCGIHYTRRKVFFTRNGVHLGDAGTLERGMEYFPTVGMQSSGEKVQMNFTGPFSFDIQKLLMSEVEAERAKIAKIPLESGVVHGLVRSYLLHAGYKRTLVAFDAACAEATATTSKCCAEMERKDNKSPVNLLTELVDEKASSPPPPLVPEADCVLRMDVEDRRSDSNDDEAVCGEHNVIDMDNDNPLDDDSTGARVSSCCSENNAEVDFVCTENVRSVIAPTEAIQDAASEGDVEMGGTYLLNKVPLLESYRMSDAAISKLDESIEIRQAIRTAVTSGDVKTAMDLLQTAAASLLTHRPVSLGAALLVTQQMVESLRQNPPDVVGALEWMRTHVASIAVVTPGGGSTTTATTIEKSVDKAIRDACSLIAYKNPMESPMQQQFDISRRTFTADILNQEILSRVLGVAQSSPLHTLIRQLVCCRQVLRELNGKCGPVPSSRSLLLPTTMPLTTTAATTPTASCRNSLNTSFEKAPLLP